MSEGILTARGGLVSHAAVVARGLSIPAVVGADSLHIDVGEAVVDFGAAMLREGDVITIDGDTGVAVRGRQEIENTDTPAEFDELPSWADEVASLPAAGAMKAGGR